jgi:predicted Zn-dependent protease
MITTQKIFSLPAAVLVAGLIASGCSTASKKSDEDTVDDSGGSEGPQDPVSAGISSERRLVIQSLSRDPLMQHPVNRQKVEQLAARLAPPVQAGKADRRVLEAYLSAQRLGNGSLPDQAGTARAIADLSMRKNVDFELSPALRLELAISAVEAGRLALAEFLLDPLVKLKEGRVRAAAFNLIGVIAVKMDRIPEAVVAFQESLKSSNDYRPAKINLGMLALDGGDFALARAMLGEAGDNALVASGEVTLARFKDGADRAAELCKAATAKHPDYKPLLFNCGLNDVQGKKDLARGKDYLARMLRAPGTDRRADKYNDRAQRLMMAIDAEATSARTENPPAK